MFASKDLAAQIDRAEAGLSADVARACAASDPSADVFAHEIAGGVAVFAGPGSPVNKIIGIGFDGPPTAEELDRVEAEYARLGAPVQAEVSTLASAAVGESLTARGYRLVGFENVLGLPLGTLAGAPATQHGEAHAVAVAPVGLDEDDAWMDVVLAGFAQPDPAAGGGPPEQFPRDVLERAFTHFAASRRFTRYLARIGGVIAGGAGLRLCDGVAQLCGAATHPAWRCRGVQTALLAWRLDVARQAGCDVAVVTTAPGSRSQQNVQAQGFVLLYTRAVLVKQ